MKLVRYKVLLLAFIFFTINFNSLSNNIRIENISLSNDTTLTFAISWDNSWRNVHAPSNHDAVWLFIKHRGCGSLKWEHADLSSNSADHTGSGLLEVYVDGKDAGVNAKGVFIRRRTHGSGNIVNQTISIRLSDIANGEFDFKVFGVEMVQVPEGEFYVGDGNTDNYHHNFKQGNSTDPFLISSEAAITAGTGAGQIYCQAAGSNRTPLNMPATFPKGFNEFYSMKYEISQQQYVDFLNCLNSDQVAARYLTINASGINLQGAWPEITTLYPHRAMGNFSWQDFLAYLDWSCLRPMTELEYEKLCRGPVEPVLHEKAWGTTGMTAGTTIGDAGLPTEHVTNAIGTGTGLLRAGSTTVIRCGFAAKPTTDRLSSGSGYYGAMELSGNIGELVVGVVHALGVAFKPVLGDGVLTNSPGAGFSNVESWPSPESTRNGAILRGGSYADAAGTIHGVSNRYDYSLNVATRTAYVGGRGVR